MKYFLFNAFLLLAKEEWLQNLLVMKRFTYLYPFYGSRVYVQTNVINLDLFDQILAVKINTYLLFSGRWRFPACCHYLHAVLWTYMNTVHFHFI